MAQLRRAATTAGSVRFGPPRCISGSFATISQLSSSCLPVPTPPRSVRPFWSRALTLTSTPFQCSVCLPYLSDSVLRFCDLAELRRHDVVEPVTV